MDVVNKTVMITGANRGIGRAFAEACAVEKAKLVLTMRKFDSELVEKLVKLGSPSVEIIEADLGSRAGVQSLIDRVQGREIDLLFNNAGLLTGGLLEEQPIADIYDMFQVNVNALVHLTHGLLPGMLKRRSGKIINHASVSAVMHFPCATTYAASKAAVWAFSDCLQQELVGTGVSTLCLFTPGIKTRMFDKIDDLYSKNFETPKDSISPDLYAQQILAAVRSDQIYLEPRGATGLAFRVAKNFTGLFNRAISSRFKR